jgi:hypothetical protein
MNMLFCRNIFCKEPPNTQPNVHTNASTVSEMWNVFPVGSYVKFILMSFFLFVDLKTKLADNTCFGGLSFNLVYPIWIGFLK